MLIWSTDLNSTLRCQVETFVIRTKGSQVSNPCLPVFIQCLALMFRHFHHSRVSAACLALRFIPRRNPNRTKKIVSTCVFPHFVSFDFHSLWFSILSEIWLSQDFQPANDSHCLHTKVSLIFFWQLNHEVPKALYFDLFGSRYRPRCVFRVFIGFIQKIVLLSSGIALVGLDPKMLCFSIQKYNAIHMHEANEMECFRPFFLR